MLEQDKKQWLQERRSGIGGTDISGIMGVNKYKTPLSVYLDKIGKEEEIYETPQMIFGSRAEKLVVEYWEEATGIKTKESTYVIDSDNDFLRGTPDRIYEEADNLGVLECKTSLDMIHPNDSRFMPFFCQIQWYMGLTGSKIGEVAILSRASCEFERFKIDFDKEFFDKMVTFGIDFWNNHVLKKIPPAPINNNDLKSLFPDHMNNCYLEASEEVYTNIVHLREIKRKIKSLEQDARLKEFYIKEILKNAEGFKHNDEVIVTWKKSIDSKKFDSKEFKIEHKDLWEKFQISSPGSRRFLIKEFLL